MSLIGVNKISEGIVTWPVSMYEQRLNKACHESKGLGLSTSQEKSVILHDGLEEVEFAGYSLGKIVSHDMAKRNMSRAQSLNNNGRNDKTNVQRTASLENLSTKRQFGLQLPSFKSLGISSSSHVSVEQKEQPKSPGQSTSTANLLPALCGTVAPLTPPPEDIPIRRVQHSIITTLSGSNLHSIPQTDTAHSDHVQTPALVSGRTQGIVLPETTNMTNPSQLQRSPWIDQASHKLLTVLNSTGPRDVMQVVSQTLPSQAKDSRSKPTFEEVLETLQADLNSTPYITITHAVPQARVMEELPKTPPSTPNVRYESEDYFGNDQTIFTHAAVVPIYHSHDRSESSEAGRLTNHIAAPYSVQVALLERYIPPTMPQEVDDFFTCSARSYLTDRLSELSSHNGSLLLIYPTRAGGVTFARKYIGPIIDPYLRQFIMLKGLTSDAAALMGRMAAVDHMIDFEEMQRRLVSLCQTLSARPAGRRAPSTYTVTHSETANIVLDRSTWINWYIEQEQSRLRQNLVEYHQAGGRMPQAEGVREVTIGMILRDFLDGFQRIRETSGDAEIEVGVFLITRSAL